MDEVLRKKINLLVHLAKSDGEFHVSETAFLKDLLKQNGITSFDLGNVVVDDHINDISSTLDKKELLFWSLQLIKVDGIIHPNEIDFCKELALKLNFNPLIIDAYLTKKLPPFNVFCEESKSFEQ